MLEPLLTWRVTGAERRSLARYIAWQPCAFVALLFDRLTLVREPATLIAGAILLIPFALSTWPILRRRAK